ncbi:hypothetical protein TWF694_011070 [Orbilia ellipsospora]|uniref:Geranylgeranyl diphosphate synthase n=1 Tax=Orbilia ellipsospora TaxID=2528407 RepID=A0AAV9XE69_9PEZI
MTGLMPLLQRKDGTHGSKHSLYYNHNISALQWHQFHVNITIILYIIWFCKLCTITIGGRVVLLASILFEDFLLGTIDVKKYISYLHYTIAGLIVYTMNCPRYNMSPTELLYCPKPANKIETLPRKSRETLKRKTTDSLERRVKPRTDEKGDKILNGNHDHFGENGYDRRRSVNSQEDKAVWLLDYPTIPDKVVLEPYRYISSLPSKKIRHLAIDALDIWYIVPQRSLEIIKNVIDTLHSSSLIIDDIEDGSELRRGQPSAHMVFGTAQAINTANYLFVKCIGEVRKLSPSAIEIFEDELRNLHCGQAMDLYWTFQHKCPSQREYIRMIDGKTGGLFRMASRLMRDQATKNRELEVEGLITLLGRFFQIRDDYKNLESSDYAIAKGSLSDLDEGKYSFMLIHALNHDPNHTELESLLTLRSKQGFLTPQQKTLVMKSLSRAKSMKYTSKVLEDLQVEIDEKLQDIEKRIGQDGEFQKNMMIRAIMARLKPGLAEAVVGTLMRQ